MRILFSKFARHYCHMNELIYLDNNATTKIDGRVLDAMMPYLTNYYAKAFWFSGRAFYFIKWRP